VTAAEGAPGVVLWRRVGLALLHVVNRASKPLSWCGLLLRSVTPSAIRVSRNRATGKPRVWPLARLSRLAGVRRMTGWTCGLGQQPGRLALSAPSAKGSWKGTSAGAGVSALPPFIVVAADGTRSLLGPSCELKARPAMPPQWAARALPVLRSRCAQRVAAPRFRLACRTRQVFPPAVPQVLRSSGQLGWRFAHRRLLNSRRGQRHDQGSRRIELFRDCGGAIRASKTPARPAETPARSGRTSGNPTSECQKRPHQQPAPPPLARKIGDRERPYEHRTARVCRGLLALGQRSLGAMAWILAPLYWFTITSLHLFLRREVDEVFKRTSSARDAEATSSHWPNTSVNASRSLADRDDDQTASRPPAEAPDAIVRGMATDRATH